MTRFRLLVFDLDGTLVDSRRDLADATNELLVSCGAAPLAEADVAAMIGEGARVLVERAFGAAGVATPADALERFLAIYERHLLLHTRPYDGMPGVLEALARHARLAVLTNKPLHASLHILEGLDLRRYFADVIGGDSEFGRKPAPAGLTSLMARARVAPDATLMVGDSAIDLQTARSAGTAICLARYGFSFWTVRDRLAGDEYVIDAPRELVDVIVRRV